VNVESWLHGIGLSKYAEVLHENGIGADVLADLKEVDLEKLGLNLGDRKRLLKAIAALDGGPGRIETPAVPLPTTAPREAERRQLTVMFVDLVGSTELSTRLDPEDMRELMRSYQNTVAGEIVRFEGHVAQFLGDGVLAYFGWPRAHEDEAERAVRAALAVTAATVRLKTPNDGRLQTRIGIATGRVVVGDLIGEGSGQRHAVVGETPNLAARLQGIAEPDTVVIAEATRRLLGDLFNLRELGPQQCKGIAEPTLAYSVLAERAIETRFAARHTDGASPLIGRDQELALLIERWQQAKATEGQVVLLGGEAGIGKSRIAEAVVEAVRGEAHYLLRYQCSPYHADSALYPVIQQIVHASGMAEGEGIERSLDRLEGLLAEASDDPLVATPLVAALLGIDGTARYGASTLTPQQRRSRTLAALADQLVGLARKKPVLWVVEDVHWIDPTTLELIERTLDRIQGARALALITARPTFVAPFANHPVVTRLALNRLGRAATQAIVDRITSGKCLPEGLVDEIVARADGVPLFVEEMTKAVIESGVLREEEDAYHLDGPLHALAIPTTLHDSLMARLDRLQPLKEVAQTAAVIGRRFDHRSIAALSALPEAELTDAMQRLVETELIFRRGMPPEATYLFKHALVRDAAYESLLKAKRIALHGRLLEILEACGDAAPEVMAQHAEAAGLMETAVRYLIKAGELAAARSASKEAISHLRAGLGLLAACPELPSRVALELDLQSILAAVLMLTKGYASEEVGTVSKRTVELCMQMGGDADVMAATLWRAWLFNYTRANHDAATEIAEDLVKRMDPVVDPYARIVAHVPLGLSLFGLGRLIEANANLNHAAESYANFKGVPISPRYGMDVGAAGLAYRSWGLLLLGYPDQSRTCLDELIAIFEKLNHPFTTTRALYWCAAISAARKDWQATLDFGRRSIEVAEQYEYELPLVVCLVLSGVASSYLAPESRWLHNIQEGVASYQRSGARAQVPYFLTLFAEALMHDGKNDRATEVVSEAKRLMDETGEAHVGAEIYRIMGDLSRDSLTGDAEQRYLQALALARTQGTRLFELRAATSLTRLWRDQGRRDEARELLAPIYDWFTEGFETPDLVEAKALLEQLG
jgi:class 3 adenylate cyclase/tetratricopeptide (TPR) repeat protein